MIRNFFRSIGFGLYRLARLVHRALFGLTSGEQRALMTWGMLGGIVALSGMLIFCLHLADERLARNTLGAEALAIVNGVFVVAYMLTGLMGLFGAGIVAIARNGEIEAKVSKDGVDIKLTAAGGAAGKLAEQTSISGLTDKAS